jgi:molybdenum cofactor synthesis domain-containing protein
MEMSGSINNTQIQAVVITVSDSRHENDDISGVTLVGLLLGIGAQLVDKLILTDDYDSLVETLKNVSIREGVNLIFTTGGTGFSRRDNTPEATRAVIEREAPGLAEAMRLETLKKTPMAILSRAVCGITGKCLIINLPGSPNGVRECFEVIKPVLQHAVNILSGETRHSD